MAGTRFSLGKRKRDADESTLRSRSRLKQQLVSRTTVRDRRAITRVTSRLAFSSDDDDKEEEQEEEGGDEGGVYDDEDEGEEEEEAAAALFPLTAYPRPAPKVIDSEKLPILLSLYYGPQKQTGETMFLLDQIASLAEVRSRLFKHFFWEFKRAGVPADLGFIRLNCFAPDLDGPCNGAWPIGTAEGYQDWIDRLRTEEWQRGQFARVQVVAVTEKNMQRMEAWGWQGHGILEPAFWLKRNWISDWVDEMDGTRWVADAGPNDANDGTEW